MSADRHHFPTIPHLSTVFDFSLGFSLGAELHCPRCNETYLHHTGVTLYNRADADETSVTDVSTAGIIRSFPVPSLEANNPSSRRNGLAIGFNCEHCDGWNGDKPTIELTLAQHKGNTFLAWRLAKDPHGEE